MLQFLNNISQNANSVGCSLKLAKKGICVLKKMGQNAKLNEEKLLKFLLKELLVPLILTCVV